MKEGFYKDFEGSSNAHSASMVGIVVLNYNGGELLSECVNSFLNLKYDSYKIIIVDNNSKDESIEKIDKDNEKIDLILCGTNQGYTGGNNIGIQRALDISCKYVLIVNNDTIVSNPNFLCEMVSFCDQNPDVGICGPKVFFRKKGVIQNTICQIPKPTTSLLWWIFQKFGFKREQSGEKILKAPVLNGVCILLKAQLLTEVGMFDNDIFMYREDTDLALRSKRKGWESVYLPVDSIIHLQKSEGYDYLSLVNFLLKRNAILVLAKNKHKIEASFMALLTLGLCTFRAILSTIRIKKVKESWIFVTLISKAMICALFEKTKNNRYGPPVIKWNDMY